MTRVPVSDAVAALRVWLEGEAVRHDPARVQRIEIPVPDLDPLRWLQAQRDPVKGYWAGRGDDIQRGALGEAEVLRGAEWQDTAELVATVTARLTDAVEARYYGGFRFGPWHAHDASWRPFGTSRFLLPQFEVVRTPAGVHLACNFLGGPAALPRWLAALDQLSFADPAAPAALQPPPFGLDRPDRAGWEQQVAAAARAVAQGEVAKLVLARQRVLDFGQTLDPFALLARLRTGATDCFLFGGVHAGLVAFMGAPPERLYRRIGRRIETEAVAGTRPRGDSPDADRALARELAASSKEQGEHRVVVDSIHDALHPLCAEWLQERAPHVVKLRTVQHLVTNCCGRLREGVSDADILARLHPTAAVSGWPRAAALAAIARVEPFDRGWYAGPVGWLGCDAAEFAVAIRSGLVIGSKLCLFAGAGIMGDSDPAAEWQETEAKLAAFVSALTTS